MKAAGLRSPRHGAHCSDRSPRGPDLVGANTKGEMRRFEQRISVRRGSGNRDGAMDGKVFSSLKDMGANEQAGTEKAAAADLPLPPRLHRSLAHFRERLWAIKIAEGALAGLLGLGLSYLLVFALDRLYDTPGVLRVLLLVSGVAMAALGLPLLWHRWVWRQRSFVETARFLKRRYPHLGDELLGIVELAHQHRQDQSQALIEAAMHQVSERVASRDLSEAIPTRRHSTYLRWTGVIVLFAALVGLLIPEAARNALARWLTPWKAPARYTFAQLEPQPERLVVPYAEPFEFTPHLRPDSAWQPSSARLRLPGNRRLEAALQGERYPFTLPPLKEPGSIHLRVGDASERLLVEPTPRPELVSLEARVRLPDYLRIEEDLSLPVRGSTLALVEGAELEIHATASRELSEASWDGQALPVNDRSFATPRFPAASGGTRRLSWRDVDGLAAKQPLELSLTTVPDAAPELFAHQVDRKRMVLEDELVSFDIQASDDFGLREIGLEWQAVPDRTAKAESATPVRGEKPVSAGAPQTSKVQVRGTFSAHREGLAPGHYLVRAFASDYHPQRERVYSPAFMLHVLTPQEHARWLTEEFGKWFRNARETYEREQQLREENAALRSLSVEELDQPETRRRLQNQASAERANSRRLDALVQAGRALVGEATKNSEFEAERLEKWAEMMRILDDIARDRMPRVADLLQQSSRAPGQAPASQQEAASADPRAEAPATPPAPSLPSPSEGSQEAPSGSSPPAEPTPPTLRLPTTPLADAAHRPPTASSPAKSPAQGSLDQALEEQRQLLEEFAKVADELAAILSSLEASTFVKRLKAASRKQIELADALSRSLEGGFGLSRLRLGQDLRELAENTAKEQEEQSRFVHHIQSDLEAYYQRKQEAIYKNVLDQMKAHSVVAGLRRAGEEARLSFGGRAVTASEYWADALDRWAEELVAAAPDQEQDSGSSPPPQSLPPELVLEIMKVLQEEMQLREETREMEQTRPGYAPDVYASKTRPLALTQDELRERIDSVVEKILALPDAQAFERELALLSTVSDVMRQAFAVLARPDTGEEAIAYETEAIELLLQSKRQNSGGGGGGGGGSSSQGGQQGGGNGSALSDIGPQGGATEGERSPNREVEQSTGKAGRELPEEFRHGLDHYFNSLDAN